MSKSLDKLPALLELEPQVVETLEFPAFLESLKDNPERVGTAASLFVREVKKAGIVDVNDVEPYRRPYYEMLRRQGIPAYKAFDKVRGSHRFMLRLMRFYEGADQNGRELNQFLVIYGPPGSAKSLTVDSMLKVLEGKVVYSVQGCPDRENPINLLKLLEPEKLVLISDALGMIERNADGSVKHDVLADLMKTAQEPCAHCFKQVMGRDKGDADGGTKAKPNLSCVKVDGVRLSSRSDGLAVWSPSPKGQGCSLPTALRQGNRGMIRMQEAFSANDAPEGEVNELQILLEATEGRRLPASSVECGSSAGYIPLDVLIVAETNEGAWTKFNEAQPDPLIYGRRSRVFSKPHNTVFSEEVKAYHDFLAQLKTKPKFDPLVLDVVASLSVASHMRDDKDMEGPDLDTRMRLYDGEVLAMDRTGATPGKPPMGMGTGLASASSRPAATADAKAPKDGYNVSKLWEKAGNEEGMTGLEMGFMFSALSQLARFGIDEGLEKPILKDGEVITSLFAMDYLKARVELALNTPALEKETKAMLERCMGYLKRADAPTDPVNLIEKRYRRWLHAQVFGVFSPDYAKRADEVFKRYRTLSGAIATGRDSFNDNSQGQNRTIRILPKDLEFMGRLETAIGITKSEEVNNFRRSFESDLIARVAEVATMNGDEAVDFENLSWDSHPDMKKGIKILLDQEIAEKIQRVLSEDVNLKSDDRKLRDASIARFDELGYSEGARKAVLEYFKKFELWKS